MDNREFFNQIAHKWDEICKHDEAKLRRIMQLSALKPGASILDVGTGTGILIAYLLEKSPSRIVAVDIAENMIELAMTKHEDSRVEFVTGDIMEYSGEKFDYIFLYSVYPHFVDRDSLFAHLTTLLKKNGRLIIAHSESKDKINSLHTSNESVKEHVLPPVEITAEIMTKYLEVDKIIDNAEMYYISGIRSIM